MLRERFLGALEAARASHEVLRHPDELPAAVARYLEKYELTGPVALAPHRLTAALAHALPQAATAAADTDCRAALTVACAGLADTGTLVLASGPDTPTRLALLPDHLLVVLDERRLLPGLPALWAALPGLLPEPPRALNLITGPSRTADIEQTLTLGAHGARALHALLLAAGE